ncbi:MAG: AMP-binding enzyme, partial [Micrococcales bacterium]
WFHTSDLGEFSTDGRLNILGRADRVLISGGLKVSLDAIEARSLQLGGVVEAAALAVADDQWGERAALVYVGSPEVADYAAEQILEALGPAGKPVRVVRVAQLPRLASGKTDYLALKALLAG